MLTETAGVNASPAPRVTSDLEKLRKVTGQVVGSVFYGTMLKAMRESKLNGTYGHGGRGEEAFSAQMHGILAERMGTQSNQGVVDVLYNQLSKQQTLISKQAALVGETT